VSLANLFYPASIAVIGASKHPQKIGYLLTKNIIDSGYEGDLFLLNPKEETILNKQVYNGLSQIKKEIFVSIIIIPAAFVLQEIKNLANHKKELNYHEKETFAVIISAGFKESGPQGVEMENEIFRVASLNNVRIVGPNCLGLINNDPTSNLHYNGSFAINPAETGNVALLSQSGALISSIIDKAGNHSFAFSKIISLGNKVDLDITDFLEFLNEDKQTEVIAIYLEGFKNGLKFIEMCKKVNKPIVVLKAGKSLQGKAAASSHTGTIAGDDVVSRAHLEKANIVQAENFQEFFDTLALFSKYPKGLE